MPPVLCRQSRRRMQLMPKLLGRVESIMIGAILR
jgi:hypothetical protein